MAASAPRHYDQLQHISPTTISVPAQIKKDGTHRCRNGVPEFSKSEMTLILETLRMLPISALPNHGPGGLATAMYHYLCERYATLNYHDEKHKVHHRLAYLLNILKSP